MSAVASDRVLFRDMGDSIEDNIFFCSIIIGYRLENQAGSRVCSMHVCNSVTAGELELISFRRLREGIDWNVMHSRSGVR